MSADARRPVSLLKRQVASAVRWNALLPLKIVLGSAASLVLFNALSKEDYGIMVLVTSLAGLLGTWVDVGIERSLPKFYPEVERDAGRAGLLRFIREISLFKLAVVAVLVLAMLLGRDWFFAFWAERARDPAVLRQLDDQRWWLFGALVALLVLGAVFDVLMQVLVAYFRQRDFNLINMAASLVQPALLIGAVVLDLGLLGILGALVLVPVLSIGLAWLGARRAVSEADDACAGAGLVPSFYRRLATHALTNYGQQLAGMVHSFQFAVLFVASLAGPAEFKFGYFLPSQVLQLLFAPLSGLQVPLFARLREQHTPERTQAAYGLLSRGMLVLFTPAAAGLVVLAPNLTHLIDPKYSTAAPVVAVAAVCLFAGSALAVARNILMVHEVYRPVIVSRLIGTLSVPLLFWLPPLYGPLGATLAIGGAGLLAEIVAWLWATRVLRLVYPWAFAGRVLMASATMAGVIWPLAAWVLPVPVGLSVAERLGPYFVGQLTLIALGGLIYLAVFRLLGGLDSADKTALAGLRLPGAQRLLRLL